MKILMISSYLPFPLFDGGSVRLYNLIKELSHTHEITLICEVRPRQSQEDIKELEKICKKVITISRKKQWSLQNILKAGISKNPFLIVGHTLLKMRNVISKELSTYSYDLIHVETSYVMQNLPPTELPVVLVEHNIEYMVYDKFRQQALLPLRPLLNIDIGKLRRVEENFWQRATQVVTVSDVDKKIVEKTGISAETVFNGVDLAKFKLKDRDSFGQSPKQFLFIGNFKWLQNRDAARWVLQDIWPKIKEKTTGEIVLRVVGRDMPDDIKNWKDSLVAIEGNSDRLTEEIFAESFALLAPIRIGGGSQYKILESMAVGTPVVTTPLGLSGLNVSGSDDLLVGKTEEDISEITANLVGNVKLYKKLVANGRRKIEDEYAWGKIAKQLDKIYQEVAKK